MLDTFMKVLFLFIAYVIGSIPFAFIVGKIKGIDIRQHGSHNIGATNAARVLGRQYFFLIYILDASKGALFVFLFRYDILPHEWCLLSPMLYGFVASLGHSFSIFLKFQGGKAVSCGSGAAGAYYLPALIIGISVFVIVLLITKYVSLGSLIASATLFVSTIFFSAFSGDFTTNLFTSPPVGKWPINLWYVTFTALIVILVFIRHKANIYRLSHNQERKVNI